MKNVIFIVMAILIAISAAGCGVSNQQTLTNAVEEETPAINVTEVTDTSATISTDEKVAELMNLTFEVDGKSVTLAGGTFEVEAAPGSASKIVTRYFGNEVFGDLNGDNKEDAAFLITQDGGGSGTFFYVVAALQTESGYSGTNAILLGDRIAPQTTEIVDGQIVVNYADRKSDEPFTTQPSIGISKHFKVQDDSLAEVYNLSQISQRVWKWESTLMNDGTTISPEKVDAFTITINEDGSVTGTTDCNDFTGQYKAEGPSKITFELTPSTSNACEGSQEGEFLKALVEAGSFMINYRDNKLIFLLKFDTGSIIFK